MVELRALPAVGARTLEKIWIMQQIFPVAVPNQNADWQVPLGHRWVLRAFYVRNNMAGGGVNTEARISIIRNGIEYVITAIWRPAYHNAAHLTDNYPDGLGQILEQPIVAEEKDIVRVVAEHSAAGDIVTINLMVEYLLAREG